MANAHNPCSWPLRWWNRRHSLLIKHGDVPSPLDLETQTRAETVVLSHRPGPAALVTSRTMAPASPLWPAVWALAFAVWPWLLLWALQSSVSLLMLHSPPPSQIRHEWDYYKCNSASCLIDCPKGISVLTRATHLLLFISFSVTIFLRFFLSGSALLWKMTLKWKWAYYASPKLKSNVLLALQATNW